MVRNYWHRNCWHGWGAALAIMVASAAGAMPAMADPSPRAVIVAGENMYGDVARQIAGDAARVESILTNPDTDPHLFEASPSVARQLASAAIVVENGAGYDPWLESMLRASSNPGRDVIVVASLVHAATGANPHLWYAPATMPAFAQALAARLSQRVPGQAAAIETRLHRFISSLEPLDNQIATMRRRFAGTAVTATEPVFGDMADALGLTMRNTRFQIAVMNDTEPSASDVAAFESDLRDHRVKLLIYNRQAVTPTARRMMQIAKTASVPVVGVTETKPHDASYQDWMRQQLDAVDQALSGPARHR